MDNLRMTKSQRKEFEKYLHTSNLRNIGRMIFFEVRDSLDNLQGFVIVGPNGKTEKEYV